MHEPDAAPQRNDDKSKLEENDKAETVAALMDLVSGAGGGTATEASTGGTVETIAASTVSEPMELDEPKMANGDGVDKKAENGIGVEKEAEIPENGAGDGTATPGEAPRAENKVAEGDSSQFEDADNTSSASNAAGEMEQANENETEPKTAAEKENEGESATSVEEPSGSDEAVPMDTDEPPKVEEESRDVAMGEADIHDEKKEEPDEALAESADIAMTNPSASEALPVPVIQSVATTQASEGTTVAAIEHEGEHIDSSMGDDAGGKEGTVAGTESSEAVGEGDTASNPAVDSSTATLVDAPVPSTSDKADTSTAAPAAAETAGPMTSAAPAPPPPPVLRGTLSFNKEHRRHIIRGMWNYENSTTLAPQRFELSRNLNSKEEVTELPQDGEFHGSFSLAYIHTTSKGKKKERSKVIPESGVNVKFTKIEGKAGEFKMDGKGSNQFGIFHINGTATESTHEEDPTFDIVLRKRYEPSTVSAPPASAASSGEIDVGNDKTRKLSAPEGPSGVGEEEKEDGEGPLPPPSESFPSGTVCLRGKLHREQSDDLGATEVVHRISGLWSSGLDLILADPQNVRGLCNRFEYEHKCSVPNKIFPISGRYIGWFKLTNEDGTRPQIPDRDLTLRFRKNNAGYHNVEGRGSNAFGKYTITGTLTVDHVITIFRHFQPRKVKAKQGRSGSISGEAKAKASLAPLPEPTLKLEDVEAPAVDIDADSLEPIPPPANGMYSVVSRGVLRLNDDGSHTCQGKWAVTRDHFNNGQTSSFQFRLEAHFAAEALAEQKKSNGDETGSTKEPSTLSLSAAPLGSTAFPVDSGSYKGSFQMRRGTTKYTRVIDQQVVLRFRKNKAGSYNVYGKGTNNIGVFKLVGTLILSGKSSGHVELYRVYPQAPAPAPSAKPGESVTAVKTTSKPKSGKGALPGSMSFPGPPRPSLVRRESSRLTKLPSKLEDDDPEAQIARSMEKCDQILHQMQSEDIAAGAFFARPVDTVALRLPTYHQIITRPMDLGTIEKKMNAKEIVNPEQFGKFVRLVFENAMAFNIEPTHPVHQAARNLLIIFNQKFRDIERTVEGIRRTHKPSEAEIARLRKEREEEKRLRKKGDKKRRRSGAQGGMSKKARLEEAQAMATSNASSMAAVVAAAPTSATPGGTVTRAEFNMMLQMIQQLQGQVVRTFNAIANLSPVVEPDDSQSTGASVDNDSIFAPPVEISRGTKKKKKMSKPAEKQKGASVEELKPLTLKEQEELTHSINELAQDHLQELFEIIRESTDLCDEDEIDLEIEQLDTATQHKLLRFVNQHSKPAKRSKSKKPKTQKGRSAAPVGSRSAPQAKKPVAVPQAAPDSLFAFGANDDSDSDSGDEVGGSGVGKQLGGKQIVPPPVENFNLGEGLGLHEEDDDDLGTSQLAASWSISKPATSSSGKDDVNEDDWGAAREEAAASKAREAERKALEEKIHADAEMAKNQRLADAAARGDEIRAQRMEQESNEARLREQKEKDADDARKAAREAAREQVKSVEQTVDLDAQRDIMKQLYEQSFLDKELGSGGGSPSSDFGF